MQGQLALPGGTPLVPLASRRPAATRHPQPHSRGADAAARQALATAAAAASRHAALPPSGRESLTAQRRHLPPPFAVASPPMAVSAAAAAARRLLELQALLPGEDLLGQSRAGAQAPTTSSTSRSHQRRRSDRQRLDAAAPEPALGAAAAALERPGSSAAAHPVGQHLQRRSDGSAGRARGTPFIGQPSAAARWRAARTAEEVLASVPASLAELSSVPVGGHAARWMGAGVEGGTGTVCVQLASLPRDGVGRRGGMGERGPGGGGWGERGTEPGVCT